MAIWIAFAMVYLALVVVRLVAWRRLGAPRGASVWLYFAPRLFAPAFLLLGGVTIFPTSPVVGLVIALIGLGYGALVVRMVRRIARAAVFATTAEELANATVEPAADFMLNMSALGLIGALVIGVLAIIWAVASR